VAELWLTAEQFHERRLIKAKFRIFDSLFTFELTQKKNLKAKQKKTKQRTFQAIITSTVYLGFHFLDIFFVCNSTTAKKSVRDWLLNY